MISSSALTCPWKKWVALSKVYSKSLIYLFPSYQWYHLEGVVFKPRSQSMDPSFRRIELLRLWESCWRSVRSRNVWKRLNRNYLCCNYQQMAQTFRTCIWRRNCPHFSRNHNGRVNCAWFRKGILQILFCRKADQNQFPKDYLSWTCKGFGSRSQWRLWSTRCTAQRKCPIYRNIYW